jgi:hypothetical protein
MIELAIHLSDPEALTAQAAALSSGDPARLRFGPLREDSETRALTRVEGAMVRRGLRIRRLYLGNEFCPFLAWTEAEYREGLATAAAHRLEATLVFGPLRELELGEALGVIGRLCADHPGLEVVANDWGLLAALAGMGAVPVSGRQLYKAKRLPRLSRQTRPQVAGRSDGELEGILGRQLAELARLPADAPWHADWLRSLGVVRCDLELVPQGLQAAAEGLPLSLHLPWTLVTGGGPCPVAALREEGGRTRCGRACRQTVIDAHYPGKTWPLVQVGQTVFAPMASLLKGYEEVGRVDRWILEPGLPM